MSAALLPRGVSAPFREIEYAENLVLKGGLFIYSLTGFDSRVTVDVDFLLQKIPNTPEQLKVVLEEIIASPTEHDFVTFEIKDVAPIALAKNMRVSELQSWLILKTLARHLGLISVWET